MASPRSDDELMELVKTGDQKAFAELFDRHGASVLSYCLRTFGGNRAAAEDVAQNAWIKVARRAETFRAQSTFKAWLMTITRNEAISELRKKVPLPLEETDEIEDTSTAESRLLEGYGEAEIQRAIDALPDPQRAVLVLWLAGEPSYEEMAETLHSSTSAVRSHLFRARRTLRQKLEKR